jgi:hypothetical protein
LAFLRRSFVTSRSVLATLNLLAEGVSDLNMFPP